MKFAIYKNTVLKHGKKKQEAFFTVLNTPMALKQCKSNRKKASANTLATVSFITAAIFGFLVSSCSPAE
jgi:hypothetical protein